MGRHDIINMATIKQKKAFAKIAENHGNLSKTMLEVGYSPNTAKKPQNLTESIGWKELTEEFLPNHLLMKVHMEGLQATRSDSVGQQVNDYPTRHKYLDSAYKVKSLYAAEKVINVNVEVPSPEILELAKRINDKFNNG